MKIRVLLLTVAAVPLFVACANTPSTPNAVTATAIAPATLSIEAKEFSFSPAQTTVKVGQQVEIAMKNAGVVEHDFTIEKISLEGKATSHGDEHAMDSMSGVDPDTLPVHVAAEPSHTATVSFTPSEAGEYEFYCTVAGHKASGMVGKLTVTP
jgi:uncharacterized cupredoxin-like copper-binding protein